MVSMNNFALLLAASMSVVRAIDATQSAELNAILNDAKGNLPDYMSVANEVSIPPAIFQIGLALATATDDSYTTFYSQLDFNQVSSLMTALPWYSSRLEPAISSALATLTPTETGSSSSEPTSTAESSTITSESPSSTEETTSSVTEESSSSEPPSTTLVTSESSETSSTSSETSSQTVSEQSSNGAQKAAVGMGAGVLAAAAMLL